MDGLTQEQRNTLLDWMESQRPKHPLEAEGWEYVAPRVKFTPEMWQAYLAIYGEGEYLILIESSGVNPDGEQWHRGQLLVSPQAQRNMTEYVTRLKDPSSAQVH